MKKISIFAILFATFFMISCGGGESLNKEDAGVVYTSVTGAIAEAQTEVMSQLAMKAKLNGKIDNFNIDENGNFTGKLEDANGGRATIMGKGTYVDSLYTINFAINFVTYVVQLQPGDDPENSITLYGIIEFSYKGNPTTNEIGYSGDVRVLGAINGDAEFDLTINTSPGKVEVAGTVAGQNIGNSTSY